MVGGSGQPAQFCIEHVDEAHSMKSSSCNEYDFFLETLIDHVRKVHLVKWGECYEVFFSEVTLEVHIKQVYEVGESCKKGTEKVKVLLYYLEQGYIC